MEKKFKIIESKINWRLTYFAMGLSWLIVVIGIGLILLCFYEIADYGFNNYFSDRPDRFFLILAAESILIILSVVLIRYMIGIKAKEFQRVVINEKGLYIYNYNNDIISQTLYKDLFRSNDYFHPDVRGVTNTQPSFTKSIKIFKRNEKGQIQEASIDFNYGIYIFKNKYELYRHFLQGIQIYRPDLKIEQYTLEEYNLTGKTHSIQKWDEFEFFITVILLALLFGILYGITMIIKYLI